MKLKLLSQLQCNDTSSAINTCNFKFLTKPICIKIEIQQNKKMTRLILQQFSHPVWKDFI